MRSETFLLGLKLEGKLCLVVGGDADAARRARAFQRAGGRVRVVAPNPGADVLRLSAEGAITLEQRAYEERDFDGVWIGVSTDAGPVLSAELARHAEARRIFFCAVDRPAESSYSHLAIARAGHVAAAVSTSGRAPALARKLREELERVFTIAGLADFADELAALRERTASPDRRRVLGDALRTVRFEGRLVLRDASPPD
jgi:siroheme synthase-like protein